MYLYHATDMDQLELVVIDLIHLINTGKSFNSTNHFTSIILAWNKYYEPKDRPQFLTASPSICIKRHVYSIRVVCLFDCKAGALTLCSYHTVNGLWTLTYYH